jgi:hypothetical protein
MPETRQHHEVYGESGFDFSLFAKPFFRNHFYSGLATKR